MKSVFDPSFKYTPSTATDLRKTFRRIRREQAAARKQGEAAPAANVLQIARETPARRTNGSR